MDHRVESGNGVSWSFDQNRKLSMAFSSEVDTGSRQ